MVATTGEKGGQIALIMEYMDQGSLYSYLHNNKKLSPVQQLRIALEAARGLQYLHTQAKPILHRDIKSMNVLLEIKNKELHAKLTDFGLSQVKEEASKKSGNKEEKAAGSFPWMAPELLTRNPQFSKASDVYSFGMLLWEIITKETPYKNVNNPRT